MKRESGESSMDDTAVVSTYQRIVALEDKLDEIENILKGAKVAAGIIENEPLTRVCDHLIEVLNEFKSGA